MTPRAIIFDLDGTIVYSHPIHFEAYFRLFEEFGIRWNFEEFNNLFAGTGARFIIDKVLRENNIADFDLETLVRRKRDMFDELVGEKPLTTVRGFFDFLTRINGSNLPRAIASGSHYNNIVTMIRNIGVLSDFPILVSAQDIARPKPAPDVFLKAAEELGVLPSECLVIEDTDFGILAAKRAGMRAIGLTTTTDDREKLVRAGADEIVDDYTYIRL